MENFSLIECDRLYELDFEQAKKYLSEHFIRLSNKKIARKWNGEWKIIHMKNFKIVYLARIKKTLSNWFMKENTDIRNVVYESDKPLFYDNNINLYKKPLDEN